MYVVVVVVVAAAAFCVLFFETLTKCGWDLTRECG